MNNLNILDKVAIILIIIGGLNWLLVGLFSWNLVSFIFGDMSALSRLIYGLVGLAAVYVAVTMPKYARK